MASISSDLRTVTMLDSSHAGLRSPVPANDNLPPILEDLDKWPKRFSEQLAKSFDHSEGRGATFAYVIVAVLLVIAWLYAINFPTIPNADLHSAKSGLALNFRGTYAASQLNGPDHTAPGSIPGS